MERQIDFEQIKKYEDLIANEQVRGIDYAKIIIIKY